MKNIISAALAFTVAFIAVTGILILANMYYRNIFAFDFRPREVKKVVKHKVTFCPKDYWRIEKFVRDEFKKELLDTLHTMYFKKKIDTVYTVIVKDKALMASLDKAMKTILQKDEEIKKKEKKITQLEDELKKTKEREKQKRSEEYVSWVKNNAKLLSEMDSGMAAKILQNYSDNIAKDLIYAMKKKKAAEILSYLSPEKVAKITEK
jgi:flagellar motility protein MotE (MotC chaperone)